MKRTVLITGTTGAIGKATAFQLAREDCNVIILGRDFEKLGKVRSEIIKETGNNDVSIAVADLSEPESIRKAANDIKTRHTALNALVNVAAVFRSKKEVNSAGLERMFATNHLGPFVLTNELLDLLKAGAPSRVLTVTAPSVTKVNFDDLHGEKKFSSGFIGSFGASKMMNILFTYALARRLENTGVTTSAFHPGLVKSGLIAEMPFLIRSLTGLFSGSPDKAAAMLCKLAIDPVYRDSNGKFFRNDGKEIKSSAYSYDLAVQERLWKLSEELLKNTPG